MTLLQITKGKFLNRNGQITSEHSSSFPRSSRLSNLMRRNLKFSKRYRLQSISEQNTLYFRIEKNRKRARHLIVLYKYTIWVAKLEGYRISFTHAQPIYILACIQSENIIWVFISKKYLYKFSAICMVARYSDMP